MPPPLPSPPAAGTGEKSVSGALFVLSPEAQAALTIAGFLPRSANGNTEDSLIPSYDALVSQSAKIHGGDLEPAERMLMAQASTLDTIFNRLAMLASRADMIPKFDTYMRLALRAQNQSRASLETLAAIKNPPVVFAKQANIAAGHQQVNNGVPAPAQSRVREVESGQSKLSEEHDELLPDIRAPALAGRVNPPMETLVVVDRAENQGWEGAR